MIGEQEQHQMPVTGCDNDNVPLNCTCPAVVRTYSREAAEIVIEALCTHLPVRRVDLKMLARQHEVQLSAGAVLVTHACKQASILKVYRRPSG
jgi:hypothetical protein